MGIDSRSVKIYRATASVKRWPFSIGNYLMITFTVVKSRHLVNQ